MSKQTLVLGGPGCGKTTALLDIVRDRLQRHAPEEIAYLAFTRKAAHEARTRAACNLGVDSGRLKWFRTIHSMAFKALGIDPGHVMSGPDYTELGAFLNVEFLTPSTDDDFGLHLGASEGEVLARLEQLCRVTGEPMERGAPRQGVDIFKARYYRDSLNAFKRERFLLDFTDMIELFVLEHAHKALKSVKTVIVDEAQDLSPIHWKALQPLFASADEVFIGGDDDQSIFQWAGADVDHFLSLDGEKRVLPVSHRLPVSIWRLANRIAARIGKRIPKGWNPRQDAGLIRQCDDVEELDFDRDDWLLLARHNYQLSRYVAVLRRRGFIYEYNGRSSVDTDHVLRIVEWESLRRGKTVKAKAALTVFESLRKPLFDKKRARALRNVPDNTPVDKTALQRDYGLKGTPPWFDALIMPENESRYYREVLRRNANADDLKNKPTIKVSTIHGVKGGEAENVVLTPDVSRAAFEELESPRTADNEHRVFYVGATRARERLFLLYPRTHRHYNI